MPTLTDRVTVVTGSTSGIGRGIARHFAHLGAAVVVHGTNAAHGEAVETEITGAGGRALFIAANLADTDDCQALYDKAVAAGCKSLVEPKRLDRWPVVVAFVEDFDGYRLEFVQHDEGVRASLRT